jgi:hypothetical protein
MARPPVVRTASLYPDRPTTLHNFRVEPFLYHVIAVPCDELTPRWPTTTVDTLLRLISTRPPSFFETSVRHLLIDDMTEESFDPAALNTIASACCGVTDLFVNISVSPLMPFFHRMNSLRRLGISLEGLFGGVKCDFTHSAFTNITHLEIFDQKTIDISLSLSPLLNLTHLAFNFRGFLHTAARVLQTYPKLLYLVFVTVRGELWEGDEQRCTTLAEDSRFVVTMRGPFREDWLLGAHAGLDFWTRAEAFVAQRRAGKIERRLSAIFAINTSTQNLHPGLAYLCRQIDTEGATYAEPTLSAIFEG